MLHVGLHHTGTSSFQYFCKTNSEFLKDFGVLYPNLDTDFAHHLIPKSFKEFRKNNVLNKNINSKDTWPYIYKSLKKELSNNNLDFCIISSEVFTELLNNDLKILEELLKKIYREFEETIILLTVRDNHRRILSALKHQIRSNNPKFINSVFRPSFLMQRGLSNLDKQINLWESIADNIYIKSLDDDDDVNKNYFSTLENLLSIKDKNSFLIKLSNYKSFFKEKNIRINDDKEIKAFYLITMILGMIHLNENNEKKIKINFNNLAEFVHKRHAEKIDNLKTITDKDLIKFLLLTKEDFGGDLDEIYQTLIKSKINFDNSKFIIYIIKDFINQMISN